MITFNIIKNNLVGSINGTSFAVPYSKEAYEALNDATSEISKATSYEEVEKIAEGVQDLISGEVKSSIESLSPFLDYDPNKKQYFLKEDGKVSPIPLPQNLVDKLKYAIDKDLPADPLIKCYTRLCRNPQVYKAPSLEAAQRFMGEIFEYAMQTAVDPTLFEKFVEEDGLSVEVATEMATVQQTPITMEGLIVTKKVVNPLYDRQRYKFVIGEDGEPQKVLRDEVSKEIDEDTGKITINDPEFAEDWLFEPAMMGKRGDAFLCGDGDSEEDEGTSLGHEIRVGKRIALPKWSMVDCDPTHSCRKGLHTGNLQYVKGWENSENITLVVAVDPAFIGCAPHGQSGPDAGVIRVKELIVLEIKDRSIVNRNLYHTSTYAAKNDARWAEERKKAIEDLDALIKDKTKEVEERKNLIPD